MTFGKDRTRLGQKWVRRLGGLQQGRASLTAGQTGGCEEGVSGKRGREAAER